MNKNCKEIKPTEIIDAWIAIEELSEGDINLSYKSGLKEAKDKTDDWYLFFKSGMEKFLEREFKKKKKDFDPDKAGIICYFGIFEIGKLVSELKNRFNLEEEIFPREEDVKGHKFSLVFALDKDLKIKENSIFLTKSGFIMDGNDVTDSLGSKEIDIKDSLFKITVKEKEEFEDVEIESLSAEESDIKEYENVKVEYSHNDEEFLKDADKSLFQEDFDEIFEMIMKKFSHYEIDMRYKIVNNVNKELNNIHSFYVNDLNEVRKMFEEDNITDNLVRYFYGYDKKERKDIQTREIIEREIQINKSDIDDIMQPCMYPFGRFPGNPEFASSLMQQMAINLSVSDKENIMSVNGPPGTGKTTLLKEIFSDFVVKQAKYIVENFGNSSIKSSISFETNSGNKIKLAKLPKELSKYNCIVASSNNAALQNIVNDISKSKEIYNAKIESSDKSFKELLQDVDYFTKSINYNKRKNKNIIEELENKENEYWGLFSLEGGRSENIGKLMGVIDSVFEELNNLEKLDTDAIYKNFAKKYEEVKKIKDKAQRVYENSKKYWIKIVDINNDIKNLELTKEQIFGYKTAEDIENRINELSLELRGLVKAKEKKIKSRGLLFFFKKLIQNDKYMKNSAEVDILNKKIIEISNEKREFEAIIEKGKDEILFLSEFEKLKSKKTKGISVEISKKYEELQKVEEELKVLTDSGHKSIDYSKSYRDLHLFVPWFDDEFRIKQTELFIEALRVKKQFLNLNRYTLQKAKKIFSNKNEYVFKPEGRELVVEAWNWINFTIPVISTTFASFGRMFSCFGKNSIGNLFIDEAGQALPQASVGAIMRSEKVMALGDPYQIKPVLTVHSALIGIINKKYNSVDETFLSTEASTQTLTDRTSRYGFTTQDDNWIGLPLWVHRRCLKPMFDISNAISYNNCMVFGKKEDEEGKAKWIDVISEDCEDKYVKLQAEKLKEEIYKKIKLENVSQNDIYVITPFKNVANRLAEELSDFVIRESGKVTNIGTVHTFQGKEAKVVYFVLGASAKTKGAARWAVYEANILNVAVTRAKEEFYVIGDRNLYESLGCKTIDETLNIIDNFEI